LRTSGANVRFRPIPAISGEPISDPNRTLATSAVVARDSREYRVAFQSLACERRENSWAIKA
jgi:hypothetical protein